MMQTQKAPEGEERKGQWPNVPSGVQTGASSGAQSRTPSGIPAGTPSRPSKSASPLTVLLADDQSLIRAGFAMVINSQPDLKVIGEAADGNEAVAMTRALRPDVVLMDVRMPRKDGIAATAEISRLGLPTRVVILTTFDLDEYVMAAIRAGASGFLLKDTSPEEMIASIRTVAAGNAIIAPSATKRLISRLVRQPLPDNLTAEIKTAGAEKTGSARTSTNDTVPDNFTGRGNQGGLSDSSRFGGKERSGQAQRILASLTPREREVLVEIAHGLSNQEIAEKLFISLPTVKTHVAHILAKTGSRDRVQAVVFAYENRLVE